MEFGKGVNEEATDRSMVQTRLNLSTEGVEMVTEPVVVSFFSTPSKSSLRSPLSLQSSQRIKKPKHGHEAVEERDRLLAACELKHRTDVEKLKVAIKRQQLLNDSAIMSLCLATYPALKAARILCLRTFFYQWKTMRNSDSKSTNFQYLIRFETGINVLHYLVRRRAQRSFTLLHERADTLSLYRVYQEMQEEDWKRRELQSTAVVKKDAYQAKRPSPLAFV